MRSALIPLFLLALPALAQIEGVVDVHVHCAPDSMPRSIDALETARMARRHGMRALLFKNHYTHTASLAYLVKQEVPGIEVLGGIALNRSVGGVNPVAVDHMVRTSGRLGRVVWMPTFDSEHYHKTNQPNPNHVPISRAGKLLPEVIEVLKIIAREKLSLATGHSSPAESLLLIREAKALGVERIIVTHPLPPLVGMNVEQQKQAAAMGAYLEYPSNEVMPSGALKIGDYAKAIRAVGPKHCILSSDLGQAMNPVHTDGWIRYLQMFREAGFNQAEIDRMAKINPALFLGLE
jgi:hypothetical protein